jgi:uncharacterized glyoxalase superfamily protein PhnB
MAKEALSARGLFPSLTVNDVEKSKKFYVDGLGFTVYEEMKDDKGVVRGYILNAGSPTTGIGLSQDDFAKGRDRVKGIGVRLWIETSQDIKALAASAKAAGLSLDMDAGPLPWGPLGFMVTDPDGYKITIKEPD